MDIRVLTRFNLSDKEELGFYGYRSKHKYYVTKNEDFNKTNISIECRPLEKEFAREWVDCEEEFKTFEMIIPQGLSLGAYIENKLVGVVISEKRKWNNTLWIHHVQVSDKYKGKSIGKNLLDKLAKIAKENGFRVIGLEVQNTNASAIQFYKKIGYSIDGVDTSFYTNDDIENGDVALFMKRKIL